LQKRDEHDRREFKSLFHHVESRLRRSLNASIDPKDKAEDEARLKEVGEEKRFVV
jgi:hypothetical protein